MMDDDIIGTRPRLSSKDLTLAYAGTKILEYTATAIPDGKITALIGANEAASPRC